MALSDQEKVEKFIEGAKLTALTSIVSATSEQKEIDNIVKKYGQDKWLYYATIASLGSILVKRSVELEEEGDSEIVQLYETAIDSWDKQALEKIEQLSSFIISKEVDNKEEFYEAIGIWVIEEVTEKPTDSRINETAHWLGWLIRTNMDIFMFH